MKQRKERIHQGGHSNIDFRSKNDIENLKVYQPWKIRTEFGTMGYSGYKQPPENKKILEVSEKINNQKVTLSEIPDPRYHKTAQFYFDKKIPVKARSLYTSERVAQLDESFIGKEVFTGDSMMISDINNYRKQKTNKGFKDREKMSKAFKQGLIIKDKSSKNKEAIQETQLVNIEAEVTLEDKVDINKVKEIRLALRRRYANRKNFRKIFKEWDNSGSGELSVNDAHIMINKLNIPINYNETRALVASSNNRNCENLNMEEFMHLIFSDNPALDVDLEKLKFKEEQIYSEGDEQMENLKNNMRNNIVAMSKTSEIKLLRDYLRIRIPILVKDLFEVSVSEGICDYESFAKVIKKFPINEKYSNDGVLRGIFEQYKCKENGYENYMNYKSFVEAMIDNKYNVDDFYNFKERYVTSLKDKIDRNQIELKDSYKSIKAIDDAKKLLAKELEADILNHKLKSNKIEKKEVNNTVPSTEFVKKSFANREQHFQKFQDLEKSYSAHPSLLKEIRAKSRYGANPPHKNTFYIIQAPEYAATYISERDRFDVRGKAEVDFIQKEKEKKKFYEMNKIEKLRNINKNLLEDSKMKDYILDKKKGSSELHRTIKLYKYEKINQIRNDLIE